MLLRGKYMACNSILNAQIIHITLQSAEEFIEKWQRYTVNKLNILSTFLKIDRILKPTCDF